MALAAGLDTLRAKGLQIMPRPDLNGITRRLARRGCYSRSRDFATRKDDLVCLSMGAIADCVSIPDLLRAYWRSPVPWVICAG